MKRPVASPVTLAVLRNMRAIRDRRKWSALDLSKLVAAIGGDMPRNVISNAENGRREAITVDELAWLGEVFGVEPWSLTTDEPVCLTCRNDALPGFACLACGLGRP